MTPASTDTAEAPRRVLYRGGNVYSPADPFATALLVEDGVVAWLGSDDAAAGTARLAPTQVVDLDGRLVTPAFVDAHVHTTETGLALDGLDLTRATGPDDLLTAVAAAHRAAGGAPGALLLGHGWDDTTWTSPPPTGEQLERAAPGAQVYLARADVHSALVSPALAARAGLEAGTGTGWDGDARVERDAHHAVRVATRDLTPAQRTAAQRRALRAAAAVGIGCVHENAAPHVGSGEDLRSLLELAGPRPAAGPAAPSVLVLWGQAVVDEAEVADVVRALALPPQHAAALLGLGGDLVVDGALGSRTAALVEPYADAPGESGHLYLDADAVAAHLVACTRAGVQAGFHVIGDAATAALLAGLDAAARQVGATTLAGARHRAEHLEMTTPDDVAALVRHGVTASLQPAFDARWGGPGGTYAARLGPRRAAAMNDVAALAAAGVPLALGSDSPVTPFAPWEAVRAASFPSEPAHAVSARAAFLAHTRGGWRAAGRDGVGALVPGAPATLAVWEATGLLVQAPDTRVAGWSTDLRSGTPGLPDLTPGVPAPRCLRTVVDGVVVHDAL